MLQVRSERVLDLDNQLCFALHSAARLVVRAYRPALDELDLTYPQYLVMLVLWEWARDRNPRPTVSALGKRLDLDSGTLTPLLKRLEQKRLIQRSRSKLDERELFVQLTAEGRALKRTAKAVPLHLLARSPLPIEELVQLRAQLQRLRKLLLHADDGVASS
jgi:MarR family transcriptional regulator, organic hydroperoxide resistance regulator